MKDITPIRSICCIGAGYVGGPTMAVIADRCPEIDVTVVDINKERIAAWNSNDLNNLPVFEPGLEDVISRARGRNLNFSTSIHEHLATADMIFISVNTPTKTKGLGAGQASDLKWVEVCARQVAEYAQGHTVVVEKSTLPVRTAATIKSILLSSQKSLSTKVTEKPTFSVLSNPEFLAEGTAISDLENPDRVLIGGDDQDAISLLEDVYKRWVPKERILRTNLWSSELSKLTANAFLAQRISSINSVSAICESTGADVREVAKAIGFDTRIGKSFLNPGPGFGGSCFKKDILNLVYLCNHFGLFEVAEYWEKVVEINNWQQHRIYKKVLEKLYGTVSGKRIAILGFAFKANTNDTRESPGISICKNLIEEGAELAIHDPKVNPNQIQYDLKTSLSEAARCWDYYESIIDALHNADAVLILTEWNQYANLDWTKLAKVMRAPAWVFDTRSIIKPEEVKQVGLNFWRIGDGDNN